MNRSGSAANYHRHCIHQTLDINVITFTPDELERGYVHAC
jgi:hypothetical protein